MAILSPTNLETADYGTTGWNAIYSSNFQKINNYLARIWNALANLSSSDTNKILVYDHSQGQWVRKNITGTTNRITITHSASDITISTPQDIHTSASPTFSSLTLSTTTSPPLTVNSTQRVLNLNADMVDGVHASTTPSPNTIPVANSQGKLNNDWLDFTVSTASPNKVVVTASNGKIDPNLIPATNTSYIFNLITTTTNLTLTDNHHVVLCDCSNNNITVTLPRASSLPNKIYIIKKIDSTSYIVAIQPQSNETIDGLTSYTLDTANQFVTIVSDGSSWRIIGR